MSKDSTFVLCRTNDYFFKYVFGSEEGFKANTQERRLYDMWEKAIFSDSTNLAAAGGASKL